MQPRTMVHLLSFFRQFLRIIVLMGLGGGVLYVLRTPDTLQPAATPHGIYNSELPANQIAYLQQQPTDTIWSISAQHTYAQHWLSLGSPQPLLAYFAAGNAATPADVPFLKDYAQQHFFQAPETSINILNRVIEVVPEDAEANYLLALLYLADNPALADTFLARAATDTLYAETANRLRGGIANGLADIYALAQILIDAEEWLFAEQFLTFAIAENPNDFVSYAYRGYVREQQGKSGLQDLEHALGLAPESALPYYFLALRWRDIPGEEAATLAALNRAYNLDPTNAAFATELGMTLQQFGDLQQAANWYDLAIALEPENEDWHQQRAAFYAETEYARDTDGILEIAESHNLFPENPHILASLGYASYLLGRYDEARVHLTRATGLDANSARTQYYYGLALDAVDDLPGAISAFTRAVRLSDDTSGYGGLAQRQLERLRVVP